MYSLIYINAKTSKAKSCSLGMRMLVEKLLKNHFDKKQDIGYLWQGVVVGRGTGRSCELQPAF